MREAIAGKPAAETVRLTKKRKGGLSEHISGVSNSKDFRSVSGSTQTASGKSSKKPVPLRQKTAVASGISSETGPRVAYLAGPMTGKPFFNFPEFFRVAFFLRQRGYEVWNPAEHDTAAFGMFWMYAPNGDPKEIPARFKAPSYREVLLWDLLILMTKCTRIVFLPGWQKSRGACVEREIALMCGLEIEEYEGPL
ncbi:MAG: DUF4406 domain-containing protein [Patescibacteria group bacterium]|nr:DUF4406 domain-containing protein [Patescibacteria group bacterium]